jgi:hypothetical protein
MQKLSLDNSTLLLALLSGLSFNGSCAALFSAVVPFSIFPLISLVLAVYCLRERYHERSMSEGMPRLTLACFLLGIFAYSAVVRVQFPQIGSNLLPSIICVVLVVWIIFKLKKRDTSV